MKLFLLVLLAFVVCSHSEKNILSDNGEPDRHPYVQCKIDFYDCVRLDHKGNVICLRDYKDCMAQMLPIIPTFIDDCKNSLERCTGESEDMFDSAHCYIDFTECMKKGIA